MEKFVFLTFSLYMIFIVSISFFGLSHYSDEDEDFGGGFDSMTNTEKILFITAILSFFLLVVIGRWWQPKQNYDEYDMTVYDLK